MSTAMTVAFVALWAIVIVQGVMLILLYRHFGLQAMGAHVGVESAALPVGQKAPPIEGFDVAGAPIVWRPRPDNMQVLLFAAPDCGPCHELLPQLQRLALAARNAAAPLDFTVVVAGDSDRLAPLLETVDAPAFEHLAEPLVHEGDGGVPTGVYGVQATPFAFVIGVNGRILSKGIASDVHRLRELIERAANARRDFAVLNFLRNDADVALAVKLQPAGPLAATRL